MVRIAVQMDPFERLVPKTDTTLALIAEMERRGQELYVYTPESLMMRSGRVHAQGRRVLRAGDSFLPVCGDYLPLDLHTMDLILLRQDPPFDMAYITSTYMLEFLLKDAVVVNDPVGVRNWPEKIAVTAFPDLIPPTLITRDYGAILAFHDEVGDCVMKPLYGHAGKHIFHLRRGDLNLQVAHEIFSSLGPEPWVTQKFLPKVVEGDKRIILINGEPLAGMNRVPPGQTIRSNTARGASAHMMPLTGREEHICETIGPHLRKNGLVLAGIDVIDGWLTEINVTSPTGLCMIRDLGGPDLIPVLCDALLEKVKTGPRRK